MGEHLVAAAVLLRNEEALLCHRSAARRWFPDVWDFPGGHLEANETHQNALRRELLEEIGVDVGVVLGAPVLHLRGEDGGLDLSVWVVTAWDGTVRNCQPEEHDMIGWFTRDQLGGLAFADDAYRTLLRRLLSPER